MQWRKCGTKKDPAKHIYALPGSFYYFKKGIPFLSYKVGFKNDVWDLKNYRFLSLQDLKNMIFNQKT